MTQTGFCALGRNACISMALALLPVLGSATCSISSVSSVAVGNYDVFATTATPGTGSFAVGNCGTN